MNTVPATALELCQALAEQAPTPGSRQRCLHWRPASDPHQVQALHRQSLEMQELLRAEAFFEHPHMPKKADWLKILLKTPSASLRPLKAYVQMAQRLRHHLQLQQSRSPALWRLASELKPDQAWLQTLLQDKNLNSDSQQQLRRQRTSLEHLVQQVDELATVAARVRLAPEGALPQISFKREFSLNNWLPERLDRMPRVLFNLDSQRHAWLLQGAHGVGKTRLLQSLHWACWKHQSGIPFACDASSRLPVFSGLYSFPAEQSLSERLNGLKQVLNNRESFNLLLIDHFLFHSSPGEGHVMAKVVLRQLAQMQSLSVLINYDPLLLKAAGSGARVGQLHLSRSGQRKQSPLEISESAQARPELLRYLKQHAWPHALVRDAEKELKALQKPSAQTRPVPTQKKSAHQFNKPSVQRPRQVAAPALPPDVPVGSWVFAPHLKLYGELLSGPDREQRVKVASENMTFKIPLSDLVLSSRRKAKRGDTSGVRIQTWTQGAEACDLHGMTVDQALPLMEKFLDTAFHTGLLQVRIVHGKGTSKLRAAVHRRLEELRHESDYIRHFRLGFPGEGDSGVTVVELHGRGA